METQPTRSIPFQGYAPFCGKSSREWWPLQNQTWHCAYVSYRLCCRLVRKYDSMVIKERLFWQWWKLWWSACCRIFCFPELLPQHPSLHCMRTMVKKKLGNVFDSRLKPWYYVIGMYTVAPLKYDQAYKWICSLGWMHSQLHYQARDMTLESFVAG